VVVERPPQPLHHAEHYRPARLHGLWWGMFAVGGMTAALLVPVVGKVVGANGVDRGASYQSIAAAVANPLVKLYLLALIALPLYHVAHRLLYVVVDLRLGIARPLLALVFYGGAVLSTLVTIGVLLSVP